MGLLDSNKLFTSPNNVEGTYTGTFTTAKTISISNGKHKKYILLNITIDGYVNNEKWDSIMRSCIVYGDYSPNNYVFKKNDGTVYVAVDTNGSYWLNTNGQSVVLYMSGGNSEVTKSITIKYTLTDEAPAEESAKPIQLLYSRSVTLVENQEDYELVQFLGYADKTLSLFRYYVISIRCKTSGGVNVPQSFTVKNAWRNRYVNSTPSISLIKTVAEVVQETGWDSDFLPVKGQDLSVLLSVSSPVAGTVYHIDIFGVR